MLCSSDGDHRELHSFPTRRSSDLADEHVLDWHHFPEVPDRAHRVRVFLEAYGELPAVDVADTVSRRMHSTRDLMAGRSEEHTSELQSQFHLVCRLLLEKKKNIGAVNDVPKVLMSCAPVALVVVWTL